MIFADGYHVSTGKLAVLTGRKHDRVNKFAEQLATKAVGTFFLTEGGKRRWFASQVLRAEIAFNAADLDGKTGGMSAVDLFRNLDSVDHLPAAFDDVFEPYPRGKKTEIWTDRTKDLYVAIWFYTHAGDDIASKHSYLATACGSREQIIEKLAACDTSICVNQVHLFNVHAAAARVQHRAREAGLDFPALREHLGRPELTAPQD
ncbi:hypothetical protein [Methylocystis iwaonis]|uniref:Uncharacterized protein n=1 Tax=Methylocystis iwaonis TaxID=2885079 RepID=A0ABM8ECF3_9HYPH|nr:hypothetical protein [Methylocystis iwaonis]BDV35675.1 hypothetical protein SS37A_32040 [Methylocystis iwaonis]